MNSEQKLAAIRSYLRTAQAYVERDMDRPFDEVDHGERWAVFLSLGSNVARVLEDADPVPMATDSQEGLH